MEAKQIAVALLLIGLVVLQANGSSVFVERPYPSSCCACSFKITEEPDIAQEYGDCIQSVEVDKKKKYITINWVSGYWKEVPNCTVTEVAKKKNTAYIYDQSAQQLVVSTSKDTALNLICTGEKNED